MKVHAFEGDDVTKPIRDLWLSINEGEAGSQTHAQIRTEPVPLWAWPDPTQPTRAEVSLPAANAAGLTIADVVSMKAPDGLKQRMGIAPPADPTTAAEPAAPAAPPMPQPQIKPGEFIWVCPVTGQKYKITITPID